jgi:hypothetical protein
MYIMLYISTVAFTLYWWHFATFAGVVPLARRRECVLHGLFAEFETNLRHELMTLTLRTMKKHMGWENAKDDYVIGKSLSVASTKTQLANPDGVGP